MDKVSFELKSGLNSFETAGAEGKLIRLEPGQVYTTTDGNEISSLRAADAVKETDVPETARAGTKTMTTDAKAAK